MAEGRGSIGCVQRSVRIAALVASCALCGGAAAQQPTPEASPADPQAAAETPALEKPAERRSRRLVLDIDKHVAKKIEEEEKIAPPRFTESIDVVARTPQVLLQRFFGGVDLECGPGGGGAPAVEEMRAYRPHTGPTADLMALAMALAGKVKEKVKGKNQPDPKYYLYAVRREGSLSYALREDRVPDSWFYNFPGVTFEMVESFSDRDTAVRAWRRMERGFATPVAAKVEPIPQWATSPCRPRR